jgi:hypothetical protein
VRDTLSAVTMSYLLIAFPFIFNASVPYSRQGRKFSLDIVVVLTLDSLVFFTVRTEAHWFLSPFFKSVNCIRALVYQGPVTRNIQRQWQMSAMKHHWLTLAIDTFYHFQIFHF